MHPLHHAIALGVVGGGVDVVDPQHVAHVGPEGGSDLAALVGGDCRRGAKTATHWPIMAFTHVSVSATDIGKATSQQLVR